MYISVNNIYIYIYIYNYTILVIISLKFYRYTYMTYIFKAYLYSIKCVTFVVRGTPPNGFSGSKNGPMLVERQDIVI